MKWNYGFLGTGEILAVYYGYLLEIIITTNKGGTIPMPSKSLVVFLQGLKCGNNNDKPQSRPGDTV